MNDSPSSFGVPPTPPAPPSPSWNAPPHPSYGPPPAPNPAFQQRQYFNRNTSATALALLIQLALSLLIQFGLSSFLLLLFPLWDFESGPLLFATLIISMTLANLLATIFCMNRTGVSKRRLFAGVRPSGALFCSAIVFIFGAQFLGGSISNLLNSFFSTLLGFEPIGFDFPLPEDLASIVLYGVLICVVAPITEELLFRGAILGSLSRYGTVFGVVISSLLFSLFHMNLDQIPFTFLAGLIFGIIAIKTGSITYAIILHAINNTSAFVLMVLTEHIDVPTAIELAYGLFIIACAIGSVIILVVALRNHRAKAMITQSPAGIRQSKLTLISDDPAQRQGDNIIPIANPYGKFLVRPAVLVVIVIVLFVVMMNILSPLIVEWLEELARNLPTY